MKLNVLEWFKKDNPNLVHRDVQVIRKTEYSTVVFFNSFTRVHLMSLKKSNHGLLQLQASWIAKVPGGYEVKLYVRSKVSTIENPTIKPRDIDKVEIYE